MSNSPFDRRAAEIINEAVIKLREIPEFEAICVSLSFGKYSNDQGGGTIVGGKTKPDGSQLSIKETAHLLMRTVKAVSDLHQKLASDAFNSIQVLDSMLEDHTSRIQASLETVVVGVPPEAP